MTTLLLLNNALCPQICCEAFQPGHSAAVTQTSTTTRGFGVATATFRVKVHAHHRNAAEASRFRDVKEQQIQRLRLRSPFLCVTIKPASRLEELLAVLELRAKVFANTLEPLSVKSRLRRIKHILDRRAKGSLILMATARDLMSPFSDEVIIGSIECSTHEFENGASPFLRDSADVCKLYVTELCVRDAFRGKGVATALLKAVDGIADSLGAAYACLFCERLNLAASRLYISLNYREVGHSSSVNKFAGALGLPTAAKAYGFFYKQISHPNTDHAEAELSRGIAEKGPVHSRALSIPSLSALRQSPSHACQIGPPSSL